MSLDVTISAVRKTGIFHYNITHNLGRMAGEAGIYKALWRPEEIGVMKAKDLIGPLTMGLALLESDPNRFVAFNPPNGWGDYQGLVEFVRKYLAACVENPDGDIEADR